MLLNTQSIKSKEDLLTDYLRCEAIDIMVITETGLPTVIWMQSGWSQMNSKRCLPSFCDKQDW